MIYKQLIKELEKKPELLTKTNMMGENILLFSVSDVESLAFLKEKGVKLDQTNKNFETVLTKLVAENNIECVKYLLENGLDVALNFGNHQDKTPLFYATSPEMVDLLVKFGADVEAVDQDERSLLHKEWKYKNEEHNDFKLIEKLVEVGVDINARDNIGDTPIAYQIEVPIADKMVELGAKVVVFNKFGVSPKMSYFKAHKKAMVKWYNAMTESTADDYLDNINFEHNQK